METHRHCRTNSAELVTTSKVMMHCMVLSRQETSGFEPFNDWLAGSLESDSLDR